MSPGVLELAFTSDTVAMSSRWNMRRTLALSVGRRRSKDQAG